jgi:hypothetical protein
VWIVHTITYLVWTPCSRVGRHCPSRGTRCLHFRIEAVRYSTIWQWSSPVPNRDKFLFHQYFIAHWLCSVCSHAGNLLPAIPSALPAASLKGMCYVNMIQVYKMKGKNHSCFNVDLGDLLRNLAVLSNFQQELFLAYWEMRLQEGGDVTQRPWRSALCNVRNLLKS